MKKIRGDRRIAHCLIKPRAWYIPCLESWHDLFTWPKICYQSIPATLYWLRCQVTTTTLLSQQILEIGWFLHIVAARCPEQPYSLPRNTPPTSDLHSAVMIYCSSFPSREIFQFIFRTRQDKIKTCYINDFKNDSVRAFWTKYKKIWLNEYYK